MVRNGKHASEAILDHRSAGRLLASLESPTPPDKDRQNDVSPPQIEGYIIDRLLGSGGGGSVWRAVHVGSERPVALKILDRRLGDGPEAERAWRELNVLSDLHLPCLPRVIDHGTVGGRLYIAVEFIEGQRLDEYTLSSPPLSPPGGMGLPLPGGMGVPPVPGGMGVPPVQTRGFEDSSSASRPSSAQALSLPSRVSLLAKVCDAVQMLHEHGVIHRDLKPSNILIDRHGEPVIIDLGIAAILEEFGGGPQRTITEEGAPIGTPAFMAPEQARGERRRISTRSDVYSLGATAFLVLTGATPHDTNTTIHEAVRRVAQDEPRDPRTLDPTLPRALSALLAKACAREPEKRYTSAAALAADLRRWLRGEPVEAQPPTPWQRAARWAGRNPVKMTAGACASIAGLSILLAMTGIWLGYRRPWDIALSADKTEARLVTLGGHVLRNWRSGGADPIPVARVVPRPASMGGGKALVVLMPFESEPSHLAGKLCVWNLARWRGEPDWMSPSGRDWPRPPREPMLSDDTYAACRGLIADVFPDATGDEVVLVMTQHESPDCIRVYDLAGSVLYEAWHRGSVSRVVWLEKARLLVFATMDNRYRILEDGRWEETFRYPVVLFALRPEMGARPGQVNRELPFIRDPATGVVIGRGPPEQPETEWYLWLAAAPVEDAPGIDVITALDSAAGGPANAILSATVRFIDGSQCQYLFDPLGTIVGRRETDWFLERHSRDAPDFVVFSREPPMGILRPAREDE